MSDAAFDEEWELPDPRELARQQNEQLRRSAFLTAIASGTPPLHAAIEVDWSPAQMRAALADKDFAQAVADATDRRDEIIERKLFRLAKKGNMPAIQFWLLNRRPERWADVKRIEKHSTHQVSVAVIDATRESVLATLKEALQSGGGIAELQPGGIIDVEVVEDGSEGTA